MIHFLAVLVKDNDLKAEALDLLLQRLDLIDIVINIAHKSATFDNLKKIRLRIIWHKLHLTINFLSFESDLIIEETK